jgi:predicted nucleic acid-binding Zn ribbon protein
MKKHRRAMMKRATILFAVIVVAALIAVSVVLHVRGG